MSVYSCDENHLLTMTVEGLQVVGAVDRFQSVASHVQQQLHFITVDEAQAKREERAPDGSYRVYFVHNKGDMLRLGCYVQAARIEAMDGVPGLGVDYCPFAHEPPIGLDQNLGIRVKDIHDELPARVQVTPDATQAGELLMHVVAMHKSIDWDEGQGKTRGKLEIAHVALDQPHATRQVSCLKLGLGSRQHGRRQIQTGDRMSVASQGKEQAPGAAAQLEQCPIGCHG